MPVPLKWRDRLRRSPARRERLGSRGQSPVQHGILRRGLSIASAVGHREGAAGVRVPRGVGRDRRRRAGRGLGDRGERPLPGRPGARGGWGGLGTAGDRGRPAARAGTGSWSDVPGVGRARAALELRQLGRTFDCVIDSGLFHTLSDLDRPRFVRSLSEVMRPGATYVMLAFSELEPGDFSLPRRVAGEEIRAAFSDGWRIGWIRPAVFESRIRPDGSRAWLSSIARIGPLPVDGGSGSREGCRRLPGEHRRLPPAGAGRNGVMPRRRGPHRPVLGTLDILTSSSADVPLRPSGSPREQPVPNPRCRIRPPSFPAVAEPQRPAVLPLSPSLGGIRHRPERVDECQAVRPSRVVLIGASDGTTVPSERPVDAPASDPSRRVGLDPP
jgi:hypothetical protein